MSDGGGPHTFTNPTQGVPAMSSLMGSPCLINGHEEELFDGVSDIRL